MLFNNLVIQLYFKRIRNWLERKNYFKKLGIPGPTPRIIFGNMLEMSNIGIQEYDMNLLKKYGKTVGYFEGHTPVILTKDVKFIKAVMIKDFSSFVNRRVRLFSSNKKGKN